MVEKIICDKSDLVAVADALREKKGSTEKYYVSELADAVHSINTAEEALPELANPGQASDLRLGKQLINSKGDIVTGTVGTVEQATPDITVSSNGEITVTVTQNKGYIENGTKSITHQLTTQAAKTITPSTSSQVAVDSGIYTTGAVTVGAIPSEYITTTDATASAGDILKGKTAYAKGFKVTGAIETKTSSDLTANGATVIVPAGYYSSDTTKTVEIAEQATPSVSISSTGKITATSEQTEGYIMEGTKTGTKQLTTQAGQTITPGTSNKTIPSGRYLIGTQIIKGDPHLVAENIKSGVNIFGVTGTHSGGIDTSDATAEADDIISGETAYVNGAKITGTNPYEKSATDTEINNQADLISQIQTALEGKASGGGGSSIETCTLSIIKVSSLLEPLTWEGTIYYTNGTLSPCSENYTIGQTFTLAKNTIFCLTNTTANCSITNGEQLFYAMVKSAFRITGNCIIEV